MAAPSQHAPLNVYTLTTAGAGQSDARPIADALCPGLVLVAGDAATGVRLPVASKGKLLYIKNTGTNQLALLNVYPTAGQSINALAVNAPLVLGPQTSATFIADRLNTWHTIPVVPS